MALPIDCLDLHQLLTTCKLDKTDKLDKTLLCVNHVCGIRPDFSHRGLHHYHEYPYPVYET